ncbi:PLP-dependent aminotransferase family protein [uncultured Pseudomonas sp.]|uniref:aminotransferase class I/II-fold pyridoxal phosphate-dependent enzyme n=1 Tax=uncultured Pseudomonas sp. TaxID=114707 RepID=UPI00258A410A|nr:PLP-dependent aminotransferase family protein [uncultured Pseudomonas sp.]
MGRSVRREFAYQTVYRYLETLISHAREGGDPRLPSLRDLARRMRVSLATVQYAYSLLEREGRVHSVPKSGYFAQVPVNEPASAPRASTGQCAPFILPPFSCGALEPLLLAHERRLARQSALTQTGSALLRNALAARHTRSSRQFWRAEDVHLATDVQALLQTLLLALDLQGGTVLVATPCCWQQLQVLQQLGMRVVEWPLDTQGGLDLDTLAQLFKRETVRLLLMPSCLATPPGRLVSLDEQREVARLLAGYPTWLLENDLDSDQCFVAPPETRLRDWVDPHWLLVLGSLEGMIGAEAPYAYVLSRHPAVCEAFVRRSFVLPPRRQQAVACLLSRGDVDSHLQQMRDRLQMRMAILCHAVEQHLGNLLAFSEPEGGRVLWCRLGLAVDVRQLVEALNTSALLAAPGNLFSLRDGYDHHLLLAWQGDDAGELEQALEALGKRLQCLRSNAQDRSN